MVAFVKVKLESKSTDTETYASFVICRAVLFDGAQKERRNMAKPTRAILFRVLVLY